MRRTGDRDLESKKAVRTLVEKIPEQILIQNLLRRKMFFKEVAEELGVVQESGESMMNVKESEKKICSGS